MYEVNLKGSSTKYTPGRTILLVRVLHKTLPSIHMIFLKPADKGLKITIKLDGLKVSRVRYR